MTTTLTISTDTGRHEVPALSEPKPWFVDDSDAPAFGDEALNEGLFFLRTHRALEISTVCLSVGAVASYADIAAIIAMGYPATAAVLAFDAMYC